jgi:hypothetical protein
MKGPMTRTHSTARRPATQTLSTARSAARKQRNRARRRTVLTLACLAAGVGGFAVKHQHTAVKERKLQALRAVATSPVSVATVSAQAQAQAQQPAPEPQVEAQQATPEPQVEPRQLALQPTIVDMPSVDEVRSQLKWVTRQVGQREVATLDANSRLLLVRSAAQKAGLADVGLDYRDVYGVIHAESSWVSRSGMGKNGVVSQGLAQFEPATARAVGLRNPHDPVEAVHAAATHLKEAARWSARRIEGLNLDAGEWAVKLREGVSVYYNLSTRGRNAWRGSNSNQMPIETRLHIRNVQAGALKAGLMAAGSDSGTPTAVAAIAPKAQRPLLRDGARGQAVAARSEPGAGSRVRVTLSGAPRRGQAAWIRGKDSITLPEGTIRWSARDGAGATGG